MIYRRRPRKPRRWTAADWPFYRPGVNPVAAHTPRHVLALAVVFLEMRDTKHPREHDAQRALEYALQTEHRNKWHRVADCLIGLWDEYGLATLRITPAYSELRSRRK
jgi:hypothetical protein